MHVQVGLGFTLIDHRMGSGLTVVVGMAAGIARDRGRAVGGV